MENQWMVVEVLVDCGAKIFRIIDNGADRNHLWADLRIPPHRAPVFASLDDHWSEGWDEVFPSGPPSSDQYGEATPFMDKLWSASTWSWKIPVACPHLATLECSVTAPITPARYPRTLTLTDESPVPRSDIQVDHIGPLPFDYCLGTHPSVAVSPLHRFDVPAANGEVNEFGGASVLGERGACYTWPVVRRREGHEVDVRRMTGPDDGSFSLHYLTPLRSGRVSCTDTAARRGLGLVFDHELFPVVCLWQVYGGRRGYYHAAMEAWTSWPGAIADAVKLGGARTRSPAETLQTTVYAILYSGVAAVADLSPDGTVAAPHPASL
jgi:hypothetical protein